jgi:hypothetical protein
MASTIFNIITANDLDEISFIAGSEQELQFDLYDSASALLNLSSATCSWKMCQYGDPSYAVVSKSGSYVTISASPINRFTVLLTSSDTDSLSGMFQHQPIVIDYLGTEFHPSQGLITIWPSIA